MDLFGLQAKFCLIVIQFLFKMLLYKAPMSAKVSIISIVNIRVSKTLINKSYLVELCFVALTPNIVIPDEPEESE